MNEVTGRRLRRLALTGVLAPSLVLGAAGIAGFGNLPGGLTPSSAVAQSIIDGGACQAFSSPATTESANLSPADVAEKVSPAVVTVINMQPLSNVQSQGMGGIEGIPGMPAIPGIPGLDPAPGADTVPGADQAAPQADGDQVVPIGSGSGFIVDEAGHVVTNNHVVDGATQLTVTFADGTDVPATVVGEDSFSDVAVLQLDLAPGQKVPGVATFGDSSKMRPGDEVVAIGTALGEFPNTVSDGTINGMHRTFSSAYPLAVLIQHDAEIWHGNSGGPLLNLHGEVIGVNTAGIGSDMMGSDTGSADMGFAIESNAVCNAAEKLVQDGKIAWPYLGIEAESGPDGQTVQGVVDNGPAANAGVQVGDVITAFDGKKLDDQNSLMTLLFGHAPGDVVPIQVDRNGTPWTYQVTLGERPDATQ
ncbi:MAG: trypsin-like peptidase domain-containing protein [Thermomicrobiales bacterium]